jgi:hypothetical protein
LIGTCGRFRNPAGECAEVSSLPKWFSAAVADCGGTGDQVRRDAIQAIGSNGQMAALQLEGADDI